MSPWHVDYTTPGFVHPDDPKPEPTELEADDQEPARG